MRIRLRKTPPPIPVGLSMKKIKVYNKQGRIPSYNCPENRHIQHPLLNKFCQHHKEALFFRKLRDCQRINRYSCPINAPQGWVALHLVPCCPSRFLGWPRSPARTKGLQSHLDSCLFIGRCFCTHRTGAARQEEQSTSWPLHIGQGSFIGCRRDKRDTEWP